MDMPDQPFVPSVFDGHTFYYRAWGDDGEVFFRQDPDLPLTGDCCVTFVDIPRVLDWFTTESGLINQLKEKQLMHIVLEYLPYFLSAQCTDCYIGMSMYQFQYQHSMRVCPRGLIVLLFCTCTDEMSVWSTIYQPPWPVPPSEYDGSKEERFLWSERALQSINFSLIADHTVEESLAMFDYEKRAPRYHDYSRGRDRADQADVEFYDQTEGSEPEDNEDGGGGGAGGDDDDEEGDDD